MGADLLVFLFACLSLCLHSPKGLLSQAHVRNPISGPAAELGPLQLRELRVSGEHHVWFEGIHGILFTSVARKLAENHHLGTPIFFDAYPPVHEGKPC